MCLAEERDLVLRYGEAYEVYRERTGFLLPKR
jgi:protein-S-isoprenylcysteine O-methyltransferase Ste14